MSKKKALGNNPLEAYLAAAVDNKKETAENKHTIKSDAKQRITIHLPIDLIDKIKNVVYWEPGLTLTALAQEAFEQVIEQLEHKRGSAYPERKERLLKGGRPLF